MNVYIYLLSHSENPTMAILLIGSTGNGKSTLGNFLIDPKDGVLLDKQIFKMAQGNLPETQNVKQVAFNDESGRVFKVIDTPGLNESDAHDDLKHMIQIVNNLQKVDGVSACVFVVKFNSKIDAQYKATVQYYRELLPSLFERNVIIVMTDYRTDERSEKLRKKQGVNVDQIKKNTLREIVESGSLTYDPLLFTIDCLPLDDEEWKFNLAERKAILKKIAAQKPFSSKDLKVAKTQYLKSLDQRRIKECEGEISGYNLRLQQVNERAKEALVKTQYKQQEITEKEIELNRLRAEVDDKDSSDLTEVASWYLSGSWKILRSITREFDMTSPCEIASVSKWTNGNCKWKNYEQTAHSVKGKVEGDFMRGVYASISLKTYKRRKYKHEVISLRQQIDQAEKHLQSLSHHLNKIKERYREYADDMTCLEEFIDYRTTTIKQLDTDYLTLDEACKRLRDLEHKGT